MKNTIFKYGVLSALILGGFITVYAFVFSEFFAKSEAAINRVSKNFQISGTPIGRSGHSDIARVDVPEAEYKTRLARIEQFREAANFQALVKERDEIEYVWGAGGGERYAELILEVINSFGYSRILDEHPEARNLRDEYATAALARSDSYGIESEVRLARNLRYSAFVPSFSEEEASKLRITAKMWIRLFARIERERDPSADSYLALQKKLNAPHDPRSSGVSDPVAMAKFEAEMKVYIEKQRWIGDQYKLRNIAADLAEPWGTKFLAEVYSKPPFSREELKLLLSEHPIAESLKKSILKARDDLASKNQ